MVKEQHPSATPGHWRALFQVQASSGMVWRLSATSLWRAANHLFEKSGAGMRRYLEALQDMTGFDPEHEDPVIEPVSEPVAEAMQDARMEFVAWMLAGLAVENLAKAAWIERDPGLKFEEGKLDGALATHSLAELVAKSCPDLSADDTLLLNAIEVAIKWKGRYPVPKKWQDMQKGSAQSFDVHDRNKVADLLTRLERVASGYGA